MVDRIQPASPVHYTNEVNRLEGQSAGSQQTVRPASDLSAELSLSGDAKAIQRALQAIKDTPDVRQDVVQQLRGDIEAGRYEVNAEALAGRLLSFLR